jgi:hypothetical protein
VILLSVWRRTHSKQKAFHFYAGLISTSKKAKCPYEFPKCCKNLQYEPGTSVIISKKLDGFYLVMVVQTWGFW